MAHTPDQIRQMLQRDELPLGLTVGLGRGAQPFPAVGNIVHDAGLGGNDDFVADFEMARNAHLPGQGGVGADFGAARNADLRDHQTVFPNGDVVGDLHQVVDLGAFADDGRPQRAAVNGDVGADFHVVLDDDVADLRDFAMDAGVEDVAKTVGANDGASMDAHAPADLCLGVKDDVGKSWVLSPMRALSPMWLPPCRTARGPILTFSPMTQKGPMWAVGSICADGATTAVGWTAGGEGPFREKQGQHAGKGDAGVGDADEHFAWPR